MQIQWHGGSEGDDFPVYANDNGITGALGLLWPMLCHMEVAMRALDAWQDDRIILTGEMAGHLTRVRRLLFAELYTMKAYVLLTKGRIYTVKTQRKCLFSHFNTITDAMPTLLRLKQENVGIWSRM